MTFVQLFTKEINFWKFTSMTGVRESLFLKEERKDFKVETQVFRFVTEKQSDSLHFLLVSLAAQDVNIPRPGPGGSSN